MSETTESSQSTVEKKAWIRPDAVISLHKLKQKKKALQARMNRTSVAGTTQNDFNLTLNNTTKCFKRKNPFLKNDENKKPKTQIPEILSESSDATLFKLLHPNDASATSVNNLNPLLSFTSVFNTLQPSNSTAICQTENQGKNWIPIDWTLKSKLRLMSSKPFLWNRTLKTSEEASGITGYVRCLDTRTNTSLDTSPNAQFHQCCLYWQHPSLPWLQLFPRSQGRVSATVNNFASTAVKDCLQSAWADSLRSLFQLVRAKQCPYFYLCANTFTACFRAAGICGYTDMHVLLTPTTRGFRHLLRREDIAFTMPLKIKNRTSDGTVDSGYDSSSQIVLEDTPTATASLVEDEDETPDDQWLQSLGVNAEEIKKINNTQARINHRTECEVDNSEQSLIFVEGVEAHGLYNFLLNCKSIVANIGPLAGVPPTLLAPVGFHGATLQSLKVRDNKIRDNNSEYYSMEFSGPILPHTLHNLYSLLPKDSNVSATFANIALTEPFSKVKVTKSGNKEDPAPDMSGSVFFGQENLSDCGLSKEILKHFCSAKPQHVQHYDSLKYNSETGLYICI